MFKIYFMCMGVLSACVSVYKWVPVWISQKKVCQIWSQEWSLAIRWMLEAEPWFSRTVSVLTSEPSHQSPKWFYYVYLWYLCVMHMPWCVCDVRGQLVGGDGSHFTMCFLGISQALYLLHCLASCGVWMSQN